MNHHYHDIRNRIDEPPLWWDENAVPRYCEFRPDEGANIYAQEIALVEIACQECCTRFLVAMSWCVPMVGNMPSLRERITDGSIHYGDPPNIGCCLAGATMNCEDLRVAQFWERKGEPHRVPELEIELPDGGAVTL